jgi:TonB family protein
MRPLLSALGVGLGLAVVAPAAHAADDLDKLLNNIPDAEIEQTVPDEEADKPPEPVPLPVYVKSVRAHIQQAWAPKIKVLKKNPKAKFSVLVKVDADGNMVGFSVMEPSGIKAFDRSVLEALANAPTPLPRPPVDLVGTAGQGLVIDFKARQYRAR